jgi:hypothetical protein
VVPEVREGVEQLHLLGDTVDFKEMLAERATQGRRAQMDSRAA